MAELRILFQESNMVFFARWCFQEYCHFKHLHKLRAELFWPKLWLCFYKLKTIRILKLWSYVFEICDNRFYNLINVIAFQQSDLWLFLRKCDEAKKPAEDSLSLPVCMPTVCRAYRGKYPSEFRAIWLPASVGLDVLNESCGFQPSWMALPDEKRERADQHRAAARPRHSGLA